MIFDKTNRYEDLTYYQVKFEIKMKAQSCQGIKLLPSGDSFYAAIQNAKV